MKKTKFSLRAVLYALLVLVYGSLAFMLVRLVIATDGAGVIYIGIMLIATVVALPVMIITHEAGHLVFGLIAGYKFCSFRVGSFMLVNRRGKYRLKRYSLAGTGGQCLMAPPEKPESRRMMVLYNMGGVIMNVAVGALCFGAFFFVPYGLFEKILWMTGWCSLLAAALNGIPMRFSGIVNDGMNALRLYKDELGAQALRTQLLINSEITNGKRLRDMSEEYFTSPDGADMSNELVASIAVFSCNRIMDSGKYDEALDAMNSLLGSGANILGLHRWLLINDCIFIHLLHGDIAAAKSLLTKEQKKFMQAMKKYPSVIRTEYAIARAITKDAKTVEKAEQSLKRLKSTYPYTEEIEAELEMLDFFKMNEVESV